MREVKLLKYTERTEMVVSWSTKINFIPIRRMPNVVFFLSHTKLTSVILSQFHVLLLLMLYMRNVWKWAENKTQVWTTDRVQGATSSKTQRSQYLLQLQLLPFWSLDLVFWHWYWETKTKIYEMVRNFLNLGCVRWKRDS